MFPKDSDIPMILYDSGSYIGDTSYIFRIRNNFGYYFKTESLDNQVFSLQEPYIDEILEDFPVLHSVLKIRALRRHRYLRKLRK